MTIDNTEYEVNKDMVDIRISSKEGFNVGTSNNRFIILNFPICSDTYTKQYKNVV